MDRAVGLRGSQRERGAALVEFMLLLPVLVAVIFGGIDFGWAFAQNIDVKSAAREGARLAVVNGGSGADAGSRRDDLLALVQERSTELDDGETEVYIQLVDDDADGDPGELGESVVVCVRYPLRSLTGVSEMFVSGSLRTKVVMRMEKIANFSSGGTSSPPWSGTPCTDT